MRFILTVIVAAAFTFGAPGPTSAAAEEDDSHFLSLAAGYYDISDDMDAAEFRAQFRAQLRARNSFWYFKPFGGLMVTSDAAVNVFAGTLVDFKFGRRFVVTPSLAVGLYEDGNGKDLGHVVQFLTGIELAYRFDDRSRLGVAFYHLSNAGLSDNNPGTEVVSLVYSIPLNYGK